MSETLKKALTGIGLAIGVFLLFLALSRCTDSTPAPINLHHTYVVREKSKDLMSYKYLVQHYVGKRKNGARRITYTTWFLAPKHFAIVDDTLKLSNGAWKRVGVGKIQLK